jgi:hypothetical protein
VVPHQRLDQGEGAHRVAVEPGEILNDDQVHAGRPDRRRAVDHQDAERAAGLPPHQGDISREHRCDP